VAALFARAEWDPEAGLGARLLAARVGSARKMLDGARFCLERLLELAARESMTLAVPPRRGVTAFPTTAELAALLEEFRGAPIAYLHDTAATYREELLDVGGTQEAWLEQFAARAHGALAGDACGMLAPLPPGTGELAFESIARLPLAVVSVAPWVAETEMRAAITLLEKL
jgi:hypothetical protein